MKARPPSPDDLVAVAEAGLADYDLAASSVTPVRSWNDPVFRVDTA